MSDEPHVPAPPEPPDPQKDTSWIAPLVKAIMGSQPLPGSQQKLECPICGCDHQKFLGVGVFHPSEDGGKLTAMFPTTGVMAQIDMPEGIKLGSEIHYTRYTCLCHHHQWALATAWHEDHSYSWVIQLGDNGDEPMNTPNEAEPDETAGMLSQMAQAQPGPGPGSLMAPPPSQSPLMSLIQGLLNSPTLSSLAAGSLTPILILPQPVPVVVPIGQVPTHVPISHKPPPKIHPAHKAPPHPPKSNLPPPNLAPSTPPPAVPTTMKENAKGLQSAPDTAKFWWSSWTKTVTEEEATSAFPTFPTTKGPHFFAAYDDAETLNSRRSWLVEVYSDIAKEVRDLIWGFLLWHDRVCLVINAPTVGPDMKKRIFDALTESLLAHNVVRVQGMGLYKKADYLALTKKKKP